MYGVVDCNSFYASCERIFRPDLAQRPVAVLSNNDGCVIALTSELKQAGLHIGIPFFECRTKLRKLDAAVFSANFTLYGDISARIMTLLREQLGTIVVYSIDEAFFSLAPTCHDPHQLGVGILKDIMACVGVPVTMGIGPTYTLAKAALGIAKKQLVDASGVYQIKTEHQREFALRHTSVGDVWGLGRRFDAKLNEPNLQTAWDYAQLPAQRLRRKLNLPHWNTYCELNGKPRTSLAPPPQRRSLIHSRTFPQKVQSLTRLLFIVRYLVTAAARRLRGHGLVAQVITIKLEPAMGRGRMPSLDKRATLAQPSADTFVLLATASELVRSLYDPKCAYRRAGIALYELGDDGQGDLDLTCDANERAYRGKLFAGIDRINERYGRDRIGFGHGSWRQCRQLLSPCYTTNVADICKVS